MSTEKIRKEKKDKKSKKEKKEKEVEVEVDDAEVGEEIPEPAFKSPIADPMISGKIRDRALKLVKKAISEKKVRRGVPECTKAIRKGTKGVVLLAADIHPMDIIAHLPSFCESKEIAYAYVSSREVLGKACGSNRAASAIFVVAPDDNASYAKAYEQVDSGIRKVHPYL